MAVSVAAAGILSGRGLSGHATAAWGRGCWPVASCASDEAARSPTRYMPCTHRMARRVNAAATGLDTCVGNAT
jgi:hypothetical protein